MKRFVWRLQRVLDIKTTEVQTKRMELLKLTEKLTQARGELLKQQRILKDIIDRLHSKSSRERLPEQEFFLKRSVTNDELVNKLKEKLSKLESQQKDKIAELIRVKRFKEGLEKLRAEAKEQFIASEEKREQKELDEAATISFVRNKLNKAGL